MGRAATVALDGAGSRRRENSQREVKRPEAIRIKQQHYCSEYTDLKDSRR